MQTYLFSSALKTKENPRNNNQSPLILYSSLIRFSAAVNIYYRETFSSLGFCAITLSLVSYFLSHSFPPSFTGYFSFFHSLNIKCSQVFRWGSFLLFLYFFLKSPHLFLWFKIHPKIFPTRSCLWVLVLYLFFSLTPLLEYLWVQTCQTSHYPNQTLISLFLPVLLISGNGTISHIFA